MTSRSSAEIPRAYDASTVEQRLYQNWLAKGYFTANMDRDKQPFTIIMPPPNVTGELHLGHALEKAIEDALVRWHRMLGDPTLWLPGTDHAGIATQWAVEQQLAAQGRYRHQLGPGGVRRAGLGTRPKVRRHHSRTITTFGRLCRLGPA